MAAKRRKIVGEDFDIGYGTTTIPTDSGGVRTATKAGIQSFLGTAHISAANLDGSNLGSKLAVAMEALPSTGGVVHSGLYGAQAITADPFSGVAKQVVMILDGVQLTSSVSITIPSNVTVRFERGAKITMATGTTLRWNGGIEAGPYQIFDWTGTGAILFAATGAMGRLYEISAEWFGAVGNGATDDSPAIQKALTSINETEGLLRLRSAEYAIATSLSFGSLRIIGSGYTTALVTKSGFAGTALAISSSRSGLDLREFKIVLTAGGADAVSVTNAHSWRIDRVNVSNGTGTGFNVIAAFTGVILDCSASNMATAFQLTRSGSYGSGGITVVGFHSGGLTGTGAIVNSSAAIGLVNVELQCDGNGPALLITGNADLTEQIGCSVTGGQFATNNIGIQIGDTGVGATKGVSITGAHLGSWTAPIAGSTGIYIVTGKATGVDIRGNWFNNYENGIKTTGVIGPGDLAIGPNGFSGTVTNYINQNGTVMRTADDTDIPQTGSFVSEQYNHLVVPGSSGALCYLPSGRVNSDITVVGNIGGGADILATWAPPGGFANKIGRIIRVACFGDTAANANNKTLTVILGSTTILTLGPTAANAKPWIVMFDLAIGPALNAEQIVFVKVEWNGAVVASGTTSATENTGSPFTLIVKGESGSSATDDIVKRAFYVEVLQ